MDLLILWVADPWFGQITYATVHTKHGHLAVLYQTIWTRTVTRQFTVFVLWPDQMRQTTDLYQFNCDSCFVYFFYIGMGRERQGMTRSAGSMVCMSLLCVTIFSAS